MIAPAGKAVNVLAVCIELRITKIISKKNRRTLRDRMRVLAREKNACQAILKKIFFKTSKKLEMPVAARTQKSNTFLVDKFNDADVCSDLADAGDRRQFRA